MSYYHVMLVNQQAVSNSEIEKQFFNELFQQKAGNKIFCFFPLFFPKFQQIERARGLKTEHLIYVALGIVLLPRKGLSTFL